jgi:glucose-1-phosphatase
VTYKAVLFDLGKVLVHFDFSRAYRAMEAICPYPEPEIRKRLAQTRLVARLETGCIEPREFVSRLCQALDAEMDYERFCEIWSSIFSEALVPEELLADLASSYRLVLVSNTNAIHFEMLRQAYPLLRHFHALVLSHEVGAAKPDRRIFEAALLKAGCRAGECFYTDDIAEFVEAAKTLGIDAVQFESAEQLERELRQRGIR